MVFLGHGIGGIFIKDVSLLNQGSRRDEADDGQFFWKSSSPELRGFPSQWHQNLVNNTVGVIFLGTPHLTSENIADHENIMGLVTRPPTSRRTKSIDRKLLDLDLQNVYLRLLSEEFDTYIRAHRPDLPVLSIWDGRESKAMQVEEHNLLGRRWKAEKYVVCHKKITHHTTNNVYWPYMILTYAIDRYLRISQDWLAKRTDDGSRL